MHLLVPGTALGNIARHQFPGRLQGSGPREQGRGLGLPNSVFTSSNTQKAQCKDTVKTSSVHLLGRDEESSEKNSFYFSGKSDDYPFLGNKMRERRVEEVCRLEERRMWQIIILWSGRISN